MTTRDKKYFFWLVFWAVFSLAYLIPDNTGEHWVEHVIYFVLIGFSSSKIAQYE